MLRISLILILIMIVIIIIIITIIVVMIVMNVVIVVIMAIIVIIHGNYYSRKGEVLLRGVGTLRHLLILSENSACQVPICAVAA